MSRMARDILAIPVTTVVSETAFSTGGRVLNKTRSMLKPSTVESLVCGQDWLRHKIEERNRRMTSQSTIRKKMFRENFSVGDCVHTRPSVNVNPNINLSPQQEELIVAIVSGKSVFITGSAGTEKSFFLQHAVLTLRRIHPPNSVFVTTSTGVVACVLGGQTLYSFAGVGLGKGTKEELISFVLKSTKAVDRWIRAKALVIDEINMIDGQLFDNLQFLSSTIRNTHDKGDKSLLWEGIQLIVSGDFFQLRPINPLNLRNEFAFESACWEAIFNI
ncbi:hypothetical protein ZOSMA_9G01700 [Zostera marina]|uniref:ATP-dependent DNA helicase n=1 Tax=Zostera marina TaxID=29655 RepID=A0A0K9NJA8_ZOSMR|nr:hypothetical protein ZOSMA_9G01700 [Zostera marina]